MTTVITEDSPWCAYAPGKQAWKSQGNYFTAEELREMEKANDVFIYVPTKPVLSGD
jgi:hypothetical protein